MKTQKQILERIKFKETDVFFGFEITDYKEALTFENAKPFLKEGAKKEDWVDESKKPKEHWEAKIKDYMPFAQDKADDERGLSAGRSISHFIAWIWLAGDDEFCKEVEKMENNDDYYAPYGKPILKRICEFYEIEL